MSLLLGISNALCFYALFVATILQCANSIIIERDFTEMCGQNVTLHETTQSLKIDFNVVPKYSNGGKVVNCTSYIMWAGGAEFKLLPFTARFDPFLPEDKSTTEVALSITDFMGKIIKLEMFASKDFYLSITPVHMSGGNSSHRYCPKYYRICDYHHCIFNGFLCDGVNQCASDESNCFQNPSEALLLLTFLGILFSFALVSFLLAIYLYMKFYRDRAYLLSADYKPTFYGTVNGSFTSSSSSNSSFPALIQNETNKKSHFYDNIQQHYSDKDALLYKDAKK